MSIWLDFIGQKKLHLLDEIFPKKKKYLQENLFNKVGEMKKEKKLPKAKRKLSEKEVSVVYCLLLGDVSSGDIAKKIGCSIMQVAAVKAHITMGTY